MNSVTWIFKNKNKVKRRQDVYIDRIWQILKEHIKEFTLTPDDILEIEDLYSYTEAELQELVTDLEEYYRKPLSSTAKRAGWQGYYFDGEMMKDLITRLI